MLSSLVILSLVCSILALPTDNLGRRQENLQSGHDAIALNAKFQGLNANSPCQDGENACVDNGFAQCVGGKFIVQGCAPGTVCAALPLVNSQGTNVVCTTAADRDARIAATGANGDSTEFPPQNNDNGQPPATPGNNTDGNNDGDNGGNNDGDNGGDNDNGGDDGDGDAQTSLTLDPAVIAPGFNNDGQDQPTAGQVPSLTSTNNFINFCKTVNLPITNGQQIADGSCNPAPMGVIPSKANMPTCKFVFPANLGKVAANQQFTIKMAIQNLETGHFVNAAENYFSAPQQLNDEGVIQGHSHVVVQKLDSIAQTTPLDPTAFAFFKGLNDVAQNGILTADVTGGLPAGVYKLSSINSASNHQPVLVPIAQHGSLDDAVYFTVA